MPKGSRTQPALPEAPKSRRADRERALSRSMREAPSLDALLTVVADALHEQAGLSGFLINLYHPEHDHLVCALAHLPPPFHGAESAYREYTFPAKGDDANGRAFATQTLLVINRRNLSEFPGSTRLRFERWHMRHLVILPLQIEESSDPAIGTLMLFSQDKPLGRKLLRETCALIAEATPLIRLHQQLAIWEKRAVAIRDTEGELLALLQFVSEMSNLTTDRDIYPRIQREFIRRFDLELAAVLMLEQGELRCVSHDLQVPEEPWVEQWRAHAPQISYLLDAADGATADVFLRNTLLCFGEVHAVRGLPMSTKDRDTLCILGQMQTFAMLPIRKHGQPTGVLWLGSFRRQEALSQEDLALAQHLCDFLGALIENSRTYSLVRKQREDIEALLTTARTQVEVLDHLASRDRLTGLYNFGSFETEANRLMLAHRNQTPPQALSMIMCDVDHFKQFNDTHGHVAGNVVLKEIATRIAQTVRESDYVARYGGEEFVTLLPRCDIDAACRLAERIRLRVAKEPIVVDGVAHHLTISLGCAECSPDLTRLSDFTARADSALYAAKHDGRNRVVRASPNPSS